MTGNLPGLRCSIAVPVFNDAAGPSDSVAAHNYRVGLGSLPCRERPDLVLKQGKR